MKALYLDDEIHRRVKLLAARRSRPLKEIVRSLIELGLSDEETGRDVTTPEFQVLAARGGSFDFLADAAEDVYSLADGEPIE